MLWSPRSLASPASASDLRAAARNAAAQIPVPSGPHRTTRTGPVDPLPQGLPVPRLPIMRKDALLLVAPTVAFLWIAAAPPRCGAG